MKNAGGPAFPCIGEHGERIENSGGMTIRDYFAAKAMQSIIAKIPFEEFPEDFSPYEKTAIGAYDYADAMLKARES